MLKRAKSSRAINHASSRVKAIALICDWTKSAKQVWIKSEAEERFQSELETVRRDRMHC